MNIHHLKVTESTNRDARQGRPGDVFWADYQTAGRGRLDHAWLAPEGVNLTFSAVFDVAGLDPVEVATFPLVVGFAVAQAVTPLLPRPTALKWPNDVLVGERKLAGVLCELNGTQVIAGIGLNVNQTVFAPEIAVRATSLALEAGRSFDRQTMLSAVLDVLEGAHARWRQVGFAACQPALAELDHLKGRIVSVYQTDADMVPVTGICGGIQADGTLLVGGTRIYAGEAHVAAQK